MTHYHMGIDGAERGVFDTKEQASERMDWEMSRLLAIPCDNGQSIYRRGHEHGAYLVDLAPEQCIRLRPRICYSSSRPITIWRRGPCNREDDAS